MSERVTINDIRLAGHCVAGTRDWFRAQGFDFRKFLREGMTVEQFLSTGDGQAQQVVARKRSREGHRE